MKWYYYYHDQRATRYDVPLWFVRTKQLIYWRDLFHKHSDLTAILKASEGFGKPIGVDSLTRFPCNPQPQMYLRMKFMHKCRRWIPLIQRELNRRKNSTYRGFINSLIHDSAQAKTHLLVMADHCQEQGWEVTARQCRKIAESSLPRLLRLVNISAL